MATTVPDHFADHDLVVETKYIRGKTKPSKVSEGIATDIIKYGSAKYALLFIVYDPERSIVDDDRFAGDFEKAGNYRVNIFR
ncbi:hypothetical protein ACFLYQ_01430 [Chloroflexota bacterium]